MHESVFDHLSKMVPFETESIRAVRGAVGGSLGLMPEEYAEQYRLDRKRRSIVYTVLSGETVIAWVIGSPRATAVPSVHYDEATEHHQAWCRTYLPLMREQYQKARGRR